MRQLVTKSDRQFFYFISENDIEKVNFILSFYDKYLISKTFIYVTSEKNAKYLYSIFKNKYFNVSIFPEMTYELNNIIIVNTSDYRNNHFKFVDYHNEKKCLIFHYDLPVSTIDFLNRNTIDKNVCYSNFLNVMLVPISSYNKMKEITQGHKLFYLKDKNDFLSVI